LPSLNALRAFAMLANTGSYVAAAQALNVTPAAVSHQVKTLEAHLCTSLVERQGRGIELTAEGHELARSLTQGFSVLEDAITALTQRADQYPVRITTSSTFATYWLLPRLPDFQKRHPGIDVRIDPSSHIIDIDGSGYDLAIRFCSEGMLPKGHTALLNVSLNVFGARDIAARCTNDLDALARQVWFQELGTSSAERWFARRDHSLSQRLNVTEMPGNLILRSLKQGHGVALTSRDWVQEEFPDGDLVELWPSREHGHYYLVSNQKTKSRNTQLFLKWLSKANETHPATDHR
jgi:LysR family glycine cleavage system transcriptional activator